MAKKILIVDDSESIREVVCFSLETAGHTVIKAEDAYKALEIISNQKFDLIITDLHMPGMDGVELIKKIRQNSSHNGLPILFLTTESQLAKKEEAKNAGATGWVVKPFVPEKLLLAVNKICQ